MTVFMVVLAIVVLVVGPVAAFWAIWGGGIRNSDQFWGSVLASFWVAIMWMLLASQM